MGKYLKIVLIILVLISITELGYFIYLSGIKNIAIDKEPTAAPTNIPTVTPNPSPYLSPVINLSATPIVDFVQNRTSPEDWNQILKMKTSTTVYEARLENIQVRTPTDDNKVILSLVFNQERNLMQTFGEHDLSVMKVYIEKGNDLLEYDYKKLKPGDLIELKISILDGLEQEIIIIKK